MKAPPFRCEAHGDLELRDYHGDWNLALSSSMVLRVCPSIYLTSALARASSTFDQSSEKALTGRDRLPSIEPKAMIALRR